MLLGPDVFRSHRLALVRTLTPLISVFVGVFVVRVKDAAAKSDIVQYNIN